MKLFDSHSRAHGALPPRDRLASLPHAFTLAVQVLLGGLYGIIGLALATPVAVGLVVLVQRLYAEDTLGDRERPA